MDEARHVQPDSRVRAVACGGAETCARATGKERRTASRSNVTVRALAEDFLARRYPANTIRRAKVAALLEAHALPRIGGMPVAAVKREHCVQLVQATLVERRVEAKGSVRRGGRAPAEALCRVLRQLFRDAVKTGRLETLAHSPAELLDPKDFGIPPPRSRDRALSDEEMALLLTHPDIDLPGLLAGAAYRGLLARASGWPSSSGRSWRSGPSRCSGCDGTSSTSRRRPGPSGAAGGRSSGTISRRTRSPSSCRSPRPRSPS